MATLVGKALFRVARALRLTSYLVGAFTALGLIASPFIASSFVNWLVVAASTLVVAVVAYLALYRCLPRGLARCAIAILPEDHKGYAHAELAIWDYEDQHGSARGEVRREFHRSFDDSQGQIPSEGP
jgi:hypothetical protein